MSPRVNLIIPSVITAPAVEPVTLDEAKLWLRVDSSDEDSLISELITAAREMAESYTRRAFITQTLRLTLDRFPYTGGGVIGEGVFQLPRSYVFCDTQPVFLPRLPVQSVTSIVTYSSADIASTVSTAVYNFDAAAGRVFLKSGQLWPFDLRETKAVEITYVAGYGLADAVPSSIKSAIKMHVMSMFEKRTVCDIPEGCMKLLQPFRIMDGLAHYG